MAEPSANVVKALEAAVAAVDAAKVPKDLREAAFNAALVGAAPVQDPKQGLPQPPTPRGDQSDEVGKIASALELDSALVGLVFDVDEDGVHLTVKRDKLSSTNKTAQQEVTYLVVAARQAAGLDEWTPTKTVLSVAHDRGVHDTNVSKAIGALDGDGLRFRGSKGSKGSREIKINAVGLAKTADIVKRLTEAS